MESIYTENAFKEIYIMAKKNLLSEAQIRRFQSLANISAINEMGSYMKKNLIEVLVVSVQLVANVW